MKKISFHHNSLRDNLLGNEMISLVASAMSINAVKEALSVRTFTH